MPILFVPNEAAKGADCERERPGPAQVELVDRHSQGPDLLRQGVRTEQRRDLRGEAFSVEVAVLRDEKALGATPSQRLDDREDADVLHPASRVRR